MRLENILSDSLQFESHEFNNKSCGCSFCRLNVANGQQVNDTQERGGDLTIDGLISSTFGAHTKNALNASGGESLKYYIHNETGYTLFDDYTYGDSLGHSSEEGDFVKSVFNRIDEYIDLDFNESSTWSGSTFDIYSLGSYSEWNSTTVGEVNDHGSGSGSYWDIYWKNTGSSSLNSFNANTIVHEIGHALGLSHPYEDPWNSNWTTDDTIMSYNISPDGWDTWFSDLDIQALQSIWGIENDYGTDGNDDISGGSSGDTFYALRGDDVINAGAGDDLIYGNQGLDTIIGGFGEDILYGGQDADHIYGNQNNDRLYGNLGDDLIYGGKSNDWQHGGQGDDRLYGNLGEDVIYGGRSNDWLHGGQGDDVLYGNHDADVFNLSRGSDRVMDFQANEGDRIAIRSGVNYAIQAQGSDLLINTDIGSLLLVGTEFSSFNSTQSIVHV